MGHRRLRSDLLTEISIEFIIGNTLDALVVVDVAFEIVRWRLVFLSRGSRVTIGLAHFHEPKRYRGATNIG